MEMSVGFADKDKGVDYYIERGYRVEESELGKVYYPKRNAVKVGKIGIRYEEKPWLSSFEIDGLAGKASGEELQPKHAADTTVCEGV